MASRQVQIIRANDHDEDEYPGQIATNEVNANTSDLMNGTMRMGHQFYYYSQFYRLIILIIIISYHIIIIFSYYIFFGGSSPFAPPLPPGLSEYNFYAPSARAIFLNSSKTYVFYNNTL